MQAGLNRLWRVRTLEMLAPQTLARIHERIAERFSKHEIQSTLEFSEELKSLVSETHQTWLSPEEGRFLAYEINCRIDTLMWLAKREKQRAVESAIATDLVLERVVED